MLKCDECKMGFMQEKGFERHKLRDKWREHKGNCSLCSGSVGGRGGGKDARPCRANFFHSHVVFGKKWPNNSIIFVTV